jgi:lipoprotein-anchoring transpeptidase ErfK/SrfK
MTVRTVLAFGALIGLAGAVGGLVLPINHAAAQYGAGGSGAPPPPTYRDNPSPLYRGGVAPVDVDDLDDVPGGPPPPPNYRVGPPERVYGPGPYSSQGPYAPPGRPSGDPRYGYGPPPPNGPYAMPPDDNGAPYAQPPRSGPYNPPPPQYGARPYDPAPRPGEPDMRPPAVIGPDQQANVPDRGIAPGRGPQQISPDQLSSLPEEDRPEADAPQQLSPELRRQLVSFPTREPAGTLVIDTPNTHLYLVLGNGQAVRYGIGVGREGFTWSGTERVSRMAEWPDWHPPKEMIERQPYLPRFMAGGPGNPLGARALYLGKTLYRIHGTNQPSTIGTFVSSGCVRLLNSDIEDLYQRVQVGTRVVVLPGGAAPPPPTAQR